MYRLGLTPWDSGIPPPELIEVIEGARRLPTGRALDLGCGTGTTTIYMATNGWQAIGVDFVPAAIRAAPAKAVATRLAVAFLVGDLTRYGHGFLSSRWSRRGRAPIRLARTGTRCAAADDIHFCCV